MDADTWSDPDGNGVCKNAGKLVEPEDCEASVLWLKLQSLEALSAQQMEGCGEPMPLGRARTSQDELDALCEWINQGASN